jgi:hypothetical protein
VANLQAQITGLAVWAHRAGSRQAPAARAAVVERAALTDLLTLRGHVLGRIADYERAAELAERLVRDAPDAGAALLAQARRTRPSTASPGHWSTSTPRSGAVGTGPR